ncbi:MAG: hypothetical protein COA40_08345 [Aequorivita sp.]|nr:MAG: hypothetical protein COA40_08345 [Aequorivita sp.]
MKTITLAFAISLVFAFQSFGQINPVQNLTWEQWYEFPNNFFILDWDEPEQPHDEIVGYNIYREDDFYIFISDETSIYNIETINGIESNCGGVDFLLYNGGGGFNAHVTAVYNPGPVESDYIETVYVGGAVINVEDFNYQKAIIYPNPSNGIINIGNKNLNKILVYDISGKKIRELPANPQIDLSDISKGIYLIKLISDEGILVDKIVLK